MIALIGPGLLFTSILLMRYASAERARFEQDARENVRGIGLSLDRDTAGLVSVLQTLATSPRIRQGDFDAFDAQARLVRESIDLDVLLRRPNGQEVVNTGVPRSAPMPLVALPFDQELARGTQRAMVSGYVPGPTPAEATYAVGVPVMMDGEVAYILSFTVPLTRLQGILSREVVPGLDHRNQRPRRHRAGAPAGSGSPSSAVRGSRAFGRSRPATPGVWEGQDRQHKPVVVIEARSRLTGWMVATSIPQALVDARVRRWIWAFAGFGLLVLATSSVLAVNLWSRVSRPLRLLAASGPALARGEAIPRVSRRRCTRSSGSGAVLSDASLRLRTREAERDRALADTRRGLTALSESEARFRHMADSAPALIWMTDETGAVSFANLHFEHLFGMPAAEFADDGWHRIVHPGRSRQPSATAFGEAFDARAPFRLEVRVIDKAGMVRWLQCEGVPRLDDDQNFLGYTGCNIDIIDAKNAEEHLLLLIHELNHRVKNTLATVQSIAAQSLRGLEGAEADAARAAFEARLLALARVHDVLTRESWEGAELSAVVADAIRPLESADGRASRFRVVGPALRLPPRLALSIAMALHELGTNAVKYGALSAEGGGVEIAWTVRREAETHLHLRWAESGGPPVTKPTRTGFGSRLIERSLARELAGEVTLSYEPTGVVCTIDAPVPPPGLIERKGVAAPTRIAPLPLAG